MGFRIAPDEAVTIAYTKPTGANSNDPIQNSAGEEADSFSAKTATTSETWSATALDASASETSLAGHVVGLNFTAALDTGPPFSVPASAFTVTVDGTAQTPGSRVYVAAFEGKGLIALQTLPTAIKSGQTVQVSYAPPLGAAFTISRNRLWGSDDKLVQRFTTQTIANNTALVANTTKGTQSQRSFAFDHAQAFTTGSRAIRLDAASVRVSKGTGRAEVPYTVSIHSSNASDQPGDSLGALTKPASLPEAAADNVRFEAPSGGIVLAADTTYFVVLDITLDDTLNHNFTAASFTDSDDEDDGKTTDWSIADAVLTRNATFTTWGADPMARSQVISVHGAPAAPTLASAAVNGTALTLTFNAKLDAGSIPAASAFIVRSSSGTDHTGTGTVTINSSDPKQVSVTLDSAVNQGETLTVNYTKPGASPLKDTCAPCAGGNAALEVATFSGKTVRNDTPMQGGVTPPPTQDPPQDPQNPQQTQDRSGGSEQRPRDPQPLQLALWTDKPGYRAGETVRLYRSLNPHDDRGSYRTFVYLERTGGEERRWLAPMSADGELHAEAVDARGVAADASRPRGLSAADRELAFEGEAPGPGLWQFVLELRPGSADEQASQPAEPLRTRRAWAKFAVAQRSVLLNRSGFDREIRSDMTLRADTLYYLGHQLFVHAGATLALEPGTLLQAWGSHAAIIIEPGGRIVAEGTREAPVVLTCSAPAGYRQPGCWAGLRILGRAPVTRLEGVAPGVLPPERPAFGGTDAEGSSGLLRYVRVEFAGASGDPEAPGPAIGLYGAGSGTLLDHVQARQSLGDGFAFSGGTVACDHCVASGSAGAGLSWERGWRGRRLAPVRAARPRGRRRPLRRPRRAGPRPRAALAADPVQCHPGARRALRPAQPPGGRRAACRRQRRAAPRPAGGPLPRRGAARLGPLAAAVRRGRELGRRRAAVA